MPLNTRTKSVPLNKITHGLRVSQLVYQYGPGGLVDFPDQTLMTAAPEYWAEQVEKIHDERLERALKVDYFGMPSSEAGHGLGVSYVRFPEWYFCPKCRRFKPIDEWVAQYRKSAKCKDDNRDMVRNLRCAECWQPLVVSRIVTVCENGHIDDFPWIEWVHARNYPGREVCNNPKLKMMTSSSSSEGLEGITVVCEGCGARANLTGAFDKDIFERLHEKWKGRYNFYCKGKHPWKHTTESCHKFPRTMQRGSSSIYFPVTAASLVIPPYSSLLNTQIEESSAYADWKKSVANIINMDHPSFTAEIKQAMIQAQISDGAQKIAFEIGSDVQPIINTLTRKITLSEESEVTDYEYRSEEYDALNGTTHVHDDRYDGDFIRESTDVAKYNLPFIKGISLINKVREVIALTGFTRINPQDGELNKDRSPSFVPIKEKNTNWYPAYQVRGEGIFIEFNEEDINEWRNANPEIRHRTAILNSNYARSFIGEKHPRKITEKYVLLHTISHLLIKQLSFECGYGIASLKERIYCGEEIDGKAMAGILIYTAGGDSEGTLGGLVRQGRADVFPRIFRKAIETARICSNDPVCSLSNGQGRDSLNLAACYSCTLIPETSCEDFNAFLDRGTVVGTMKRPEIGFFAEQLRDGWSAIGKYKQSRTKENGFSHETPRTSVVIPDFDTGLDTSSMEWTEIWNNLIEYAGDSLERNNLQSFSDNALEFEGKEKPRMDAQFRLVKDNSVIYSAELIWPQSKVALFMAENREAYDQMKQTDWKCFICDSNDGSLSRIIECLKESD